VKKIKAAFFMLMYLPLLITITALAFLPDTIPVHYGFDGTADRYGSKYETLILPVMAIPFGYLMLFMAKQSGKSESNRNSSNEKVTTIMNVMTLVIFNALTLFFIYSALNKVENLNMASIDLHKLVFSLAGVFLIVTGSFLPKCIRNGITGIRTKWSMSSEQAWTKSQRFGGVAAVVTGIVLLIGSLFVFRGTQVLGFSITVLILLAVITVAYSYFAARNIEDV
jgi:uncharacterized membrane protein